MRHLSPRGRCHPCPAFYSASALPAAAFAPSPWASSGTRKALLAGTLATSLIAATQVHAATPSDQAARSLPSDALGSRAGGASDLRIETLGGGAVELRAGGTVVALVALGTPPLRRGTPQLRALTVEGHHVAELRVPVRGQAGEEVWIGDLATRPARVIWWGMTGPRDADEETGIAVEVTPERIFQYQTATQVSRCDGEPVRLFTKAWDFGSAKFRPILATVPEPAAALRRLTARRADPAMPTTRPIGGFHFTAASTTAAAGDDARSLSAPTALDDGDPRTVWSEGLGGDGRGEFLTARASAGHYHVRGLRLVPGDASSAARFKQRNRLRAVSVVFGPEAEQRFDLEFPEDPAASGGNFASPYWVAFPKPVDAACLTVIVRQVYRGSEPGPAGGGGTTAIADLEVFTELDDASGVPRLVADMTAGSDCASRIPLLAALGEAAVLPAAQAIATGAAKGIGRACLVESLARIEATERSAPALAALAAALVGATTNEERLVSDTIRRAQAKNAALVPVKELMALLAPARNSTVSSMTSSTSLEGSMKGATVPVPAAPPLAKETAAADSARAARILAQLDRADAAASLVAAAGAADLEARLSVIQALGQSPAVTGAMVIAAIEAARGSGASNAGGRREADLVRALPGVIRRAPQERRRAIETARRSLDSSPSFEVRARAILSLGQMGSGEGVATTDTGAGSATGTGGPQVASDLAGVRERSDDAVLRFLATRELGSMKSPASLAALRIALGDRDPRVRESAAQGLGLQRDVASEAVLIEAAKSEPWPFARRAQVEALARTCGAPARDLLARAMERDVDEVRRASLVGLVRCRDPRARPTLLATLKNRRASAALRELSGAMLGELGDRAAAPELADTVASLVNEAEGDLAIEGVATSALRSLGQLGGSEAVRVSARMATDGRHPAYRKVAVESLGRICDPDVGAKALQAARGGNDASLTAAALKAQEHCK